MQYETATGSLLVFCMAFSFLTNAGYILMELFLLCHVKHVVHKLYIIFLIIFNIIPFQVSVHMYFICIQIILFSV